jgi:hypothetical protein
VVALCTLSVNILKESATVGSYRAATMSSGVGMGSGDRSYVRHDAVGGGSPLERK